MSFSDGGWKSARPNDRSGDGAACHAYRQRAVPLEDKFAAAVLPIFKSVRQLPKPERYVPSPSFALA
jgi:hypothetical protein